MATLDQIQVNTILEGDFFPERVRVEKVRPLGGGTVSLGAVGLRTRTYYDPVFDEAKLAKLKVVSEGLLDFSGNGEDFFLFMEAHRIRNAFQFDPLYAVNVSQVDPLPHQIDAVYHYILKNPSIRFLLADDPGAGKTIMAGLVLTELKYRGLVDRVLIVTPGHLKPQWLREMKDHFHETFKVIDRGVMEAAWGQNVWRENNRVITSIDFAKQDDVMAALGDSHWDMVIVDEAHKMAAYRYGRKIDKTERYRFGELLSGISTYLLFLTATPHRGDPENFRLFLDLLEPGFFSTTEMLEQSIRDEDNPLFLRRLKEDLKDFDGKPIFPPRHVYTKEFRLAESNDEMTLYNAVTDYVQNHYNVALQKEKRNVAFAMVILQRRMASSTRAIRRSLERRRNRLQELYDKGEWLQSGAYDPEERLEEMEESERWAEEEELLEKLTSAETLEELGQEISKLDILIGLAKQAEKSESELKLTELKKVMEAEGLSQNREKLLIFTEAKDTLDYLVEKLQGWGYSVTSIHGGLNLDRRIAAEHEFHDHAQVMVATEAAGEGINLQFCHICINYDIPWNPNRLEQRMGRVHRYLQQHEVNIYNLVAVDTIEGKILRALFDKLQSMRKHLGDRVFDVIGITVAGKSLKEMILEAISKTRTLDEIIAGIEAVPDEGEIAKVKEATLESLATHHIDLTRILGERRIALENRLVPEYVESFFLRAADRLSMTVEKRQDGFLRVSNVPFDVRNQPHSFKLKFGEVRRDYLRFSFDKQQAQKAEAEFIAMGHPLMEAVVDSILQRCESEAGKGAVLWDPDDLRQGLLWFLETEIKDGAHRVAGRRLFALYQEDEIMALVSPSIHWDLKPASAEAGMKALARSTQLALDNDGVTAFIVGTALEEYQSELLEQRTRDAAIKEKYGIASLNHLIGQSEEKLADYYARENAVPEPTVQQEERKKRDLLEKRERLQKAIKAETHLWAGSPTVLGVARILPLEARGPGMRSDPEIERVGMETAMRYESEQGRFPQDVSAENKGYDVRSDCTDGSCRYIEVKARAQTGQVELTPNEWLMSKRLREDYWLYVVSNAATVPELYLINDPYKNLDATEEVSIVRYVVRDWKTAAVKEQ